MLRLKQKKADEAKKAEEIAASVVTETPVDQAIELSDNTAKEENNGNTDEIKLLGIGGKSSRSTDGVKKVGKKKTPGEIRIQKGELCL